MINIYLHQRIFPMRTGKIRYRLRIQLQGRKIRFQPGILFVLRGVIKHNVDLKILSSYSSSLSYAVLSELMFKDQRGPQRTKTELWLFHCLVPRRLSSKNGCSRKERNFGRAVWWAGFSRCFVLRGKERNRQTS